MRWSHRAREHLPCPPRWLDRYDTVADHLSSLPTTLIHGDFTPANIIVAGRRTCPIDWERAAIGPPVLDLASIIAGLRPEQAQSMIDAYAAVTSQPIDRRSLTMAQLHLCVQWLGWAPGDWQPTHQHRDWLSDADHLAGEVGL